MKGCHRSGSNIRALRRERTLPRLNERLPPKWQQPDVQQTIEEIEEASLNERLPPKWQQPADYQAGAVSVEAASMKGCHRSGSNRPMVL